MLGDVLGIEEQCKGVSSSVMAPKLFCPIPPESQDLLFYFLAEALSH